MNSLRHHNEHDDRGETLVEVLCTIIILGTAIAALLAGLGTTALNSARHRDMATGNALLRSYAEAVKQTTRSGYVLNQCPANYNVPATAYTLPSGWAAPTNQTVNPCPGGNDPGTQQVRITIVTPRNATQTLDVWVRGS